MQATTSHGYALLIGVNDYSAYDRSQDQAKGTSDLPGSVNDVKAWWTLCNALGFQPDNVRVLSSPGIHGEKLEGATEHTFGEATEKGILEGMKWLVEKLGNDPTAVGLLTYSGHGDSVEHKGLVLCPTNVTGADLQHAIPYAALRAMVDAAHAGDNLTVVLDCCHAGGGGGLPRRKGLSLTGRPVSKEILAITPEISGRVFSASPRDGTAYQAEFAGRYHGAFTWALTSTLEQWKAVEQGDCLRLTVSYGEALRRSQGLLSTLSFQQTPGISGAPNVADLAVFQSGLVPQPTSPDPNVSPIPMQVDPGDKDYRVYEITWNGSKIGSILVPRCDDPTGAFLKGLEYWYLTSNITGSTRQVPLEFKWADHEWTTTPSLGTLSFKMPQSPTWTATSAPSSAPLTFVNNNQFSVVLTWGLTFTSGRWGGTLDWFSTTGQNTVFGGTGAATSATLTENTLPVVSWYRATTVPA